MSTSTDYLDKSEETSTHNLMRVKFDIAHNIQREHEKLIVFDDTYNVQPASVSTISSTAQSSLSPEYGEDGKNYTSTILYNDDNPHSMESDQSELNVPPIILIDNNPHKHSNNVKVNMIIVYGCLIAAQIMWSGFHAIGKYTFTFFSPFVLPIIRCAGAIPIFFCYAYWKNPQFYCISKRDHTLMLLLGFLMSIAQQVSNYGLDLSDASVAGMVQPATPIFATMLALMFKREKATTGKISGIALAIIGALLVVLAESKLTSSESTGSDPILGTSLLFTHAVLGGVSIIIQKPMFSSGFCTHTFTFYLFLYGGIFHAIVACFFLSSIDWVHLPLTFIPIVLYTCFFTSFVAYSCFVYATKHLPASLASLGIILQSFFSPLFGAIFLNEVVNYIDVLGGIAIIAGIAAVAWDKHKESQVEQPKLLTERSLDGAMLSVQPVETESDETCMYDDEPDETYIYEDKPDDATDMYDDESKGCSPTNVIDDHKDSSDNSNMDDADENIEDEIELAQLPYCGSSGICETRNCRLPQNREKYALSISRRHI